MQSRLPTILGKAIEDAIRTLNEQAEEEQVVDLSQSIERMGELMTDLSGNAKLRPIIDDGEADVALWNKEIAKYFQGMRTAHTTMTFPLMLRVGKDFMNAPWLFAEAYKYRRLHECFSISKFWKDYDVFYRQKVTDLHCHNFALLTEHFSVIPSRVQPMLFLSFQCGSQSHSRSRRTCLPRKNWRLNGSCSWN
jgi:hypothetical protein